MGGRLAMAVQVRVFDPLGVDLDPPGVGRSADAAGRSVFSLMTSFTHGLRTSFTHGQVRMIAQGGVVDLESEGCERTASEVCNSSQQRSRGDERVVPGVRDQPADRILVAEAFSGL